jgi:putative ABC transport system ATP-binding protein
VPVLETHDLRKTYDTDGVPVEALRGVDMSVGAGELVAIMGPSGCGKSTLLHLCGGLDTPTSGSVRLDGRDLASLPERELDLVRRRRIGFVFQAFNLVGVLNVRENVALPAVIDGTDRDARVDGLLQQVGIDDVRDKLPTRLSGGQQQRVAIARALVNEPAVLLADEPTGNLDYRAGIEVMALFRDLQAGGQTIVVVTHNPTIAACAQRVLFLRDGRVVDETGGDDAAALVAKLADL